MYPVLQTELIPLFFQFFPQRKALSSPLFRSE